MKLKKYIFATFLVIITSILPSIGSSASFGLSLRGGMFFPAGSKNPSSIWGASYELMNLGGPLKGSLSPGSINISGDYYAVSSNDRRIPILLNYKKQVLSFYFSGGAGFSINNFRTHSNNHDSLTFAYQLSVGHDMLAGLVPLFVEARYLGAAGQRGVQDLNGIGLFLGVRF